MFTNTPIMYHSILSPPEMFRVRVQNVSHHDKQRALTLFVTNKTLKTFKTNKMFLLLWCSKYKRRQHRQSQTTQYRRNCPLLSQLSLNT